MSVDLDRLRELAGTMSQEQIAAELGVTRKVIYHRMKELGLQGQPESQTYVAKHKRMRKVRGRAADHRCLNCDSQARDWAQLHDTTGEDPWDYVPLCRKCHLVYDKDARLNPESLAKWRASAGPAIAAAWTPERRAAQAERMREMRCRV